VDSVPNAIFLDDDVIVLPSGLRVIGSTLWDLIDEGKIDQHDQKWRDMGLKGVDNIRIGDHYLSARDVNAFYRKSRSFIEDQLRSLSPAERERTIVCTHFWPTFLPWRDASGAVPDEWYHATASDMDEFLAQWGPNRWLCGHSHETKAVTIGPTRVSSNPRMGAGPDNINPEFSEEYIVDVPR
jgi:Icc-related predicted phosphoesterase